MHNCIINNTGNYIESIGIQPIAALPNQHKVFIQSQLLDAKDPAALHVKYQAVVSTERLRDLRNYLNQVLGNDGNDLN